MADVIDQILFSKQNKRFRDVEIIARTISLLYSGNSMLRDSIFTAVTNYAGKKEILLEKLQRTLPAAGRSWRTMLLPA